MLGLSEDLASPDHFLRYLVALDSSVFLTQERGREAILRPQLSHGHIPAL